MSNNDTATLVAQLREALDPVLLWDDRLPNAIVERARTAIAAVDRWLAAPPVNQCGETCERAKLCATCARGLDPESAQHVGDTSRIEIKTERSGTRSKTARRLLVRLL